MQPGLSFIFSTLVCLLFMFLLFSFGALTCASLLCLIDWTASTRSTWRSAWLQANAPKSHSSLLSTTSWKWNMLLRWWKAVGESNYLLLCHPLFPCSTYHFSGHAFNFLQLLVASFMSIKTQQKLVTLAFFFSIHINSYRILGFSNCHFKHIIAFLFNCMSGFVIFKEHPT